jgi:hypothetical protein
MKTKPGNTVHFATLVRCLPAPLALILQLLHFFLPSGCNVHKHGASCRLSPDDGKLTSTSFVTKLRTSLKAHPHSNTNLLTNRSCAARIAFRPFSCNATSYSQTTPNLDQWTRLLFTKPPSSGVIHTTQHVEFNYLFGNDLTVLFKELGNNAGSVFVIKTDLIL